MVVMRVGLRRVVLDAPAQPLDVDVERLGVADIVGAPDAVDERVAGEHAPGVVQQQLEQLELLERQLALLAPDRDLVALGIEAHVADLEHPRCRGRRRRLVRRPAQHRPHPGHQLPQPVGLGDVVVGADLQADDGVDLRRPWP